MIDLRSDTVTKPTPAMRRAIAEAEVGDDVFRTDPTVNALEERVAELLGKEAAVYVPSGTMSNQIGMRSLCRPGDVVLASENAHIDWHEVGAANAISGLSIHQLPSVSGTFTGDDVRAAVPQPTETMPAHLFQPVTLVAVENTHNAAGGTVWPKDRLDDVVTTSRSLGLATHLDGARLWNAAVASDVPEAEWAAGFDTVSVCFSKGLGAPMGSALAGSADLVATARRYKTMHGGGFRQAGLLAAGALHALEHHRERLAEDHEHARRLARGLAETPGYTVDVDSVHTNLVYIGTERTAVEVCAELEAAGVWVLPLGHRLIRAVTHLDVTSAEIEKALAIFRAVPS